MGKKKLTHGSLFTGVGGFDLGFEAAGIKTVWQCEIDLQCRSVLARRWPKVARYSDVSTLDGAKIAPVDIVSFGSPCQDLSIAGKRAGLDGERSKLFYEAIRVIKEMRDATNNQYPRIAIWENVRGALTSNDGRDFHAAIQALAGLGAMDVSWRVVNTCNFGPPQRRVRVFVVADLGGECAGPILAHPPRVLWHPPSCEQEGTKSSGKTEGGARGGQWGTDRAVVDAITVGGRYDAQEACVGRLVYAPSTSTALTAGCGNTQDDTQVPQLTVYQYDGFNYKTREDGPHKTLRSNRDSGDLVAVPELGAYRVRRLTPRECERLQGWPDDHTRHKDTGQEVSDTARYKMAGNGISAPVAQWIGENLRKALRR